MAHAYPERKTDFLIVHPKFGVYLGSAQGRGYWSKVDSVGQPAAVTFPSQQEAIAYMASWAVSQARTSAGSLTTVRLPQVRSNA
jgi:hypothetical protein